MAATAKAKGRAKKASGTPRRRRGVKLRPTELGATELAYETPPEELKPLADAIRADGGAVLATYREPLGGHALMLAALPLEKIAPTPFQRDISDAHVRRLTQAMTRPSASSTRSSSSASRPSRRRTGRRTAITG